MLTKVQVGGSLITLIKMLIVYTGSDQKRIRQKARAMLAVLQKKRPDSEVHRIDSDSWSNELFESHLYGRGLFSEKSIVVLDNLLTDADVAVILESKLQDIKDSKNAFIAIFPDAGAKLVKALKKSSEVFEEITEVKVVKKDFPMFSLADPLANRDRKLLWITYMRAKLSGVLDDDILNIFLWQLRTMIIAYESPSEKESGQKSFVYQKSKRSVEKYGIDKVKQMHSELVSIFHRARYGGVELGMLLEKFVLVL